MIQKFFDHAISTNWNYNPDNFPNKEIPMSVVVTDFLSAYQIGHKTAYYSNTYDGRRDGVEDKEETKSDIQDLINELTNQDGDDYCESCTV